MNFDSFTLYDYPQLNAVCNKNSVLFFSFSVIPFVNNFHLPPLFRELPLSPTKLRERLVGKSHITETSTRRNYRIFMIRGKICDGTKLWICPSRPGYFPISLLATRILRWFYLDAAPLRPLRPQQSRLGDYGFMTRDTLHPKYAFLNSGRVGRGWSLMQLGYMRYGVILNRGAGGCQLIFVS